jgi:hypothetical protein
MISTFILYSIRRLTHLRQPGPLAATAYRDALVRQIECCPVHSVQEPLVVVHQAGNEQNGAPAQTDPFTNTRACHAVPNARSG